VVPYRVASQRRPQAVSLVAERAEPMLLSILSAGLLAIVVYDSAVMVPAMLRGKDLARASSPYEAHPATPGTTLLVVGDSTGVGTGAEDPADSVAGRLGADLPDARVDNLAVNGALTKDVLGQLERAPLPRYDAIMVQVGGNDALRFTNLGELASDIDAVLDAALRRGDYVALMSTGDLGEAPAIPWPLDTVFSGRSRAIRDRFAKAAESHGADYVDLFAPAGDNPFARDPDRYYASDGLHLSGDGYGIWYDRLRAATDLPDRLAEPHTSSSKD
jgi:lysophospholipase L1-like esterase